MLLFLIWLVIYQAFPSQLYDELKSSYITAFIDTSWHFYPKRPWAKTGKKWVWGGTVGFDHFVIRGCR